MSGTATAAPAGFTQGLLASLQPWLTGGSASPLNRAFSQYGGTTGLLSAMLQDTPGAQGAAAFGRALEANKTQALRLAAARQSVAGQGLNLQFMAARMPLMLAAMRQRLGQLGGAPQAPQAGASPNVAALAPLIAANIGRASGGAAMGPGATQAPSGGAPPVASVPPQPSAAPPARGSIPSTGGAFGLLNNSVTDSILGLPWANNELSAARAALQYSPNVANAQAVARNKVSQDEAQLYQAYASGNPALIQGLTTRLREDLGQEHVGSMSGIMTRQNADGSWTTVNPSSGLVTNSRTGSTFLPGAIRAFAARAAAEAGGEKGAQLAAETGPVGSGGYGGGGGVAAPSGRQGVAATPAATGATPGAPAGWDAVQTPGFVPQVLEASGAVPLEPGNTGAEALKTFQTQQAQTADETLKSLNDGADTAQQLLTQAQQIDEAATDFTPERFANAKGELMSVLQPLGVLSKAQLQSLGSFQDASKLQIQMQTMLTRSLGSREAAQVFQKLGHAVPGLTLSPQGLTQISAFVRGMARWKIAQNTYGQRLAAQQNVEGVANLQSNFETHSNPAFYILASAPAALRAQMIARSPNPQALMSQWLAAAQQGLAPGPNDYEGF